MSISTKSTNINANSIEAIVPTSGTINIGTDQTTGILNIGCGKNVRTTGNITIGIDTTFGQSGTINIGHLSANPTINYNGTFNTGRAFTINADVTFLGTITLNGTGTPNINQLGYRVIAALLTTTPVTGSNYGTLNMTRAGIYIFQFNLYQTASTKGTTNYVTFSGTNVNTTRYGATSVDGTNFGFSGSQTVRVIGSSTYSLTLTTNSTCSAAVSGYITATRIA